MKRCIASLLIFAAFAVAPLASSAAPITVPTDLIPGQKYRLAFVTSTTRDATSSAILDYNNFVAAVAAGVPELAALGTTWTAIGSTDSIDARDNTSTNPSVSTGVPIYRLDDTRIADHNADFWDGAIAAPLNTFESGTPNVSAIVFTGSASDGSRILGDALGDSDGQFNVWGGRSHLSSASWINFANENPLIARNFYAISAEITVVPEPSAMVLACLAGAGLAVASRYRRRYRKPEGRNRRYHRSPQLRHRRPAQVERAFCGAPRPPHS